MKFIEYGGLAGRARETRRTFGRSAPNESMKGRSAAFDIDFDQELPRLEFFPVYRLAKTWHCSSEHVLNLVESGELRVGIDLRNKASSKTMIRIPRKSVLEFLTRRKDLRKVVMSNPPAFDIDFDDELPRWEFFPVHWLAANWHCTGKHVTNLMDSGELPVGIDLSGTNGSRMMLRVPRKSLVRFLNARKDLGKVAASNPRPKYRSESIRRSRKPNEAKGRRVARRKAANT